MSWELDPRLIDRSLARPAATNEFHAINHAHGTYSSVHFVIRLSPLVHELIASLPPGVRYLKSASWDQIQAFSTYLHETIHWWQHIGSTCGLMLSLSYPAQTHANLNHLRQFLATVGPVKSITDYACSAPGPSAPGTASGLANTIINNHYDIAAYRFLVINPERAERLVQSGRFESPGHSYWIAHAQGLNAIASSFDRNLAYVPNFPKWDGSFRFLRESRHSGFFFGSPVTLPPIGAMYLFEAQARYGQLQYLHFGSGGRFEFEDARDARMLASLYTNAFDGFLAATGLDRPATIGDSAVGLFLIIADLAINPGEGFPFDIADFAGFVRDVDPGVRFLRLCAAARELGAAAVASEIVNYSSAEYQSLSEGLCARAGLISPLVICREIARWCEEGEGFRDCLARHDSAGSADLNPTIDVLIGQYLSFVRDKLRFAHILCWPGPNMAGSRATNDAVEVFTRQSPLFIDRADDQMIVPIIRPGLAEKDVLERFQRFYDGHALYVLTDQWIQNSGPFTYPFRWLQPNGSDEQVKRWADGIFEAAYQTAPDAFTLL